MRLADTTFDGDETTMIQPSPRTRQYVEDYTDGATPFPWEDMPVLVVSTVESDLRQLLRKRVTAAGGRIVRRFSNARIIVIPYEPEESVLAALQQIKSVEDGSASVVKPHWVLRTFFDGYADTHTARPRWENIRVSVADLGDEELRLDVMISLERQGNRWSWTARHPAEGWRQHYRTYKARPWHDGTVLEDLIRQYVEDGIDSGFLTTAERRTRGVKTPTKRAKRGAEMQSALAASTKRKRGERQVQEEKQPYRGVTKKRSKPQAASSSASEDEEIDGLLRE
ncbi:unnamed protein product [Cutaneotrichosporon oleaginosum]